MATSREACKGRVRGKAVKEALVARWVPHSILRTEGTITVWVCLIRSVLPKLWVASDNSIDQMGRPGAREGGWCQYLSAHRHSTEEGRGGWGREQFGGLLKKHIVPNLGKSVKIVQRILIYSTSNFPYYEHLALV